MSDTASRPAGDPGRWTRAWNTAWRIIRPSLWLGVTASASIAFALLVIRPFQQPAPDEDVATAWNDSIGQLGIRPIYPPEEDIYVGDLWAVLVGTGRDDRSTILGSSARIAHIDLTELLKAEEGKRIRFRTDVADAAIKDSEIPREADGDAVRLSLVAFPGISISHGRRLGTSVGSGWFGWGASNDVSFSEEINLTDTSTYGVPLGKAYGVMLVWCANEGKAICTDDYTRHVLAQTGILGADDIEPDGKSYTFSIELRLVTRAFLAKTIKESRTNIGSRGAAGRAAYDGGLLKPAGGNHDAQQETPAAPGDKAPNLVEKEQVLTTAADPRAKGAGASIISSDGSMVEMKQTYARPIVFGYRAASKRLKNSLSDSGNPE